MLVIQLVYLEALIGLGDLMKKLVIKSNLIQWYEEATKYLSTYYGQLAFLKIKPNETFELDEQARKLIMTLIENIL